MKFREEKNEARAELNRATLNVKVLTAGIGQVLKESDVTCNPYQIEDAIEIVNGALKDAMERFSKASKDYYDKPEELPIDG